MIREADSYGTPLTLYGKTKLQAEKILLGANGKGNLRSLSFRPPVSPPPVAPKLLS